MLVNDADADGNISYTQKTSLEAFKGTTQIWSGSLTATYNMYLVPKWLPEIVPLITYDARSILINHLIFLKFNVGVKRTCLVPVLYENR